MLHKNHTVDLGLHSSAQAAARAYDRKVEIDSTALVYSWFSSGFGCVVALGVYAFSGGKYVVCDLAVGCLPFLGEFCGSLARPVTLLGLYALSRSEHCVHQV